MLDSNRKWVRGDDYGPNDSNIYTAGIHVGNQNPAKGVGTHWNAIECFGTSAEEANERRALILGALNLLSVAEVTQ